MHSAILTCAFYGLDCISRSIRTHGWICGHRWNQYRILVFITVRIDADTQELIRIIMTENRDLLPDILNYVDQGVAMYDSARNLVMWNEQYEHFLQFPSDYLKVGLPISEVVITMAKRGDYGVDDSITFAQDRIEDLWSGLDTQLEVTVANENSEFGKSIYQLYSKVTEKRELVMTCTNVTTRVRVERELRESRGQFRDFAESSADWFWEMDSDLRFSYLSPNVERVVGVAPEWHYGKTRQELLNDDYDYDLWDAHLQNLKNHQPFRDFTYYRVGEGIKSVWLSTSGTPVFDVDGVFKGYRGCGADITERKAVDAQLIQADKLATLGTLSAGMAHELSQPLNIIRLKVDSIIYEADDSAERCDVETKEMEEIVSQVIRMADIIEHMRVFSRKEIVSTKIFRPCAFVIAALRLVENQFAASNIKLEKRIPEVCEYIRGSPGQLEQVILNLMTNARDAIAAHAENSVNREFQGKIVVEVGDDKVEGKIVISIFDNGGGIDESIINNIFDPFFTTKEVGKGTGLGLSVSYSIVESMGGKLEAQNILGGACFRISLRHTPQS